MATDTEPVADGLNFSAIMEDNFPVLGGAAASAVAAYYGSFLIASMNTNKWNISALYTAAFDWSAIQTAFMFAVYAFVAAHPGDFVSRIRESQPFIKFLVYSRRAVAVGFLVTAGTVPLLLIQPAIGQAHGWLFWVLVAWFGFVICSVLAFVRVAYIFSIIARTREDPPSYRG